MTADQSLRVAIIGAGAMAKAHAAAFRMVEGVELCGICSRTPDRARQLATDFGIPVIAQTLAELKQQAKPDLLVVAVSVASAYAVVSDCLALGLPILTEKPVAMDLPQSRALQVLCHERKAQVWIGMNRRQYGATQAALTDLAGDPAPRLIQVEDQQDRPAALRIGHPPETVRNWMYANSVHLVDYLRIFGRGAVTGVSILRRYDPDAACFMHAAVDFASGDHGVYTAVWDGPGPWACSVTTARRRWDMRPLETARYADYGVRGSKDVPATEADQAAKAGFLLQAQGIVAAVRNGAATSVPTIDDAMQTMELVARLYELN